VAGFVISDAKTPGSTTRVFVLVWYTYDLRKKNIVLLIWVLALFPI
jgi:hypothetical protein